METLSLRPLEIQEMEQIEGGGAIKCAAGTLGGAILGGLAGAAAGSVVPVLGTFWGGVAGIVGGALSGGAASC